jgi:hypothetical protein
VGSRILRAGAVAAIAVSCLGPCGAAPVAIDTGTAPADADHSSHAAPLGLPGASMPLAGVPRGDLGPDQGDPLAAARDPALLPIDMQGVGAQAHPAPSALPKNQPADAGADDDGLKKLALSARDWMHDVFGRPDNAQDRSGGDVLPGKPGASDLGLPVETQAGGMRAMPQRAERPVEMPPPGAGSQRAATPAPARESAGARLLADSAPEYTIQMFLKRAREVLVHPLTWLAIVLIGVTHILVSRGRR